MSDETVIERLERLGDHFPALSLEDRGSHVDRTSRGVEPRRVYFHAAAETAEAVALVNQAYTERIIVLHNAFPELLAVVKAAQELSVALQEDLPNALYPCDQSCGDCKSNGYEAVGHHGKLLSVQLAALAPLLERAP